MKWSLIGFAGLFFIAIVADVIHKSTRSPEKPPQVEVFNVDKFCDPTAYYEAFQPPFVEGKLVFIHTWSKHRDPKFSPEFPPEMIATKEEEVGTIVWLESKREMVGEYKDIQSRKKDSDAYKLWTQVSVINQRTRAILVKKTFEGADPAQIKTKHESAVGALPYRPIARYLLTLPRN